MGERRQNIRQVEMGERMDELFDLACIYQKELIEHYGEPYRGIPKEKFLANYRIKQNVGKYASERYFEDFRTVGKFIDGEIIRGKPSFKVAEKPYQLWLKENHPDKTEAPKETTQKPSN